MLDETVINSITLLGIKIITKVLYYGILFIPLFILSACWTENHLHQAIRYSEAAIVADDGETIAKHSEKAKAHAYFVPNQNNISPADRIHLAVGIVSLDQAIEKGKHEADDLARKAVRGAVAHFKEVKNKPIEMPTYIQNE